MKLNYNVTLEDASCCSYKTTKLLKLIEDFENSGKVIAEITFDPEEYVSAKSAQNSFTQSLKRFHRDTIKASQRNGHLYLINTLLIK